MSDWNINDDWKIRLNLSPLAQDVMQQDMESCGAKSRTAFLNTVFLGYWGQARASVSTWRDALTQQLQQRLTPIKEELRQPVIDALLADIGTPEAPEKSSTSFLHNFSEAVIQALESNTQDACYYKNAAAYFRAVVEEYCRLPQYRRDRILHADAIREIETAIAGKRQLTLTNAGGTVFHVHPVQILPDPQGSCNYLACYARESKQLLSQKRLCSFRINQLSSVRCTAAQASLTKSELAHLEKAIRVQGIQFLTGDCRPIQVRLTEKGVRKLHRYHTLRPPQSAKPEGDVYTFFCTPTQAEYYFVKLGADAEILSPASLRKKLARAYAAAAEQYHKKDTK